MGTSVSPCPVLCLGVRASPPTLPPCGLWPPGQQPCGPRQQLISQGSREGTCWGTQDAGGPCSPSPPETFETHRCRGLTSLGLESLQEGHMVLLRNSL